MSRENSVLKSGDEGVECFGCGGGVARAEGVVGSSVEGLAGGGGEERRQLKSLYSDTLELMELTHQNVTRLSEMRHKSKLSNWRVVSVAKELKELIRVMNCSLF